MDYPESRPQPSGLSAEGASVFASAFSSAASKGDDWWSRAEDQTAELIASIQPIRPSEERRKAVADFVHYLIRNCLGGEVSVVTFGSLPLKTYLPDGDIDLTITARSDHTDLKETWAQDVVKELKRAEENADEKFRVKEVQYIQAEVKIIKCLVENIVVDISFNQTGGLSTFCFLEQVDRFIDQNHLFKRSIILVKAWCYYESRILGAHHGLISTYALETLVLYIFHVFHSSSHPLHGPLEVLYLFLVYFCNFDWDKYCVSLWGPLPLALITERPSVHVAEPPRKDRWRLLITKEFIEYCIEKYAGVPAGQESNQGRNFNAKYLNVLDPIRDTNNLGRSVNVGSFKRIRSAFGLGARTLGEVIECPKDQISARFKSFFSCTFRSLERYRSLGRPDTGNDLIHGFQHPNSGAANVNLQERFPGGFSQENGADSLYPKRNQTYAGENVRSQLPYGSRTGQFDTSPHSEMDIPEQLNGMQSDSTMRRRATPTMTDAPCSSKGRDSGNTVNTKSSTLDNMQEGLRATAPGPAQSNPGNSSAESSEGQRRQVGDKGRYSNVEGETARVQIKGSNHDTTPEHFEKPVPVNRRSPEDHDNANHSLSKSLMVGEYQAREPIQDSVRWGSSLGDPVRQGEVSRNRTVSDTNLVLSNHDSRRPPGLSDEFKMNSNHGKFHRNIFSSDENDTSTSGRASGEDSKATHSKWVAHQKDTSSLGEKPHQGNSQDRGSHNTLQPLPYPKLLPPYLHLQPYGSPVQMHMAVSSSIPVHASNLTGPPSASSLHAPHSSSPSGESVLNRTNSYVAMPIPHVLPSTLPASQLVSIAPLGDGAGSHIGGFSPHAEEQREHWRSSLEDQVQPLHRASVTSNVSSGRSFPIGNTPLSTGSPSPFSVAPTMLPQSVPGKFKPTPGGRVRAVEMAEFLQADESLSRSSLSDERQGEALSQLEEGVDYLELDSRNRENHPISSNVKASVGKPSKATSGTKQLSRVSKSSSDECDMEVVRSVDGNAAEPSIQGISQPSQEEVTVGNVQAALPQVPLFTLPPQSYEEMPPTTLTSYHNSSTVQSGSPEPVASVPYQSLQVPTHQASSETDSISSFPSERQVLLPISVGVPGPSGYFHPPISEYASMSISPSLRNRPMETAMLPQQVYYSPSGYFPPFVILPTGTDGVGRTGSAGGLYSNGSMDFGTDILGTQSLEDSRVRTISQVGMNVAERPKGAGAVISSGNKMETSHAERLIEEADPGDQQDILRGNLKSHEKHLSRSFLYSCMVFPNPNSAIKFQQGPQSWEGSGRLHGNLNPHAGLNISYPPGVVVPLYPSRGRMADGLHQPRSFVFPGSEDILPKPRVGTGTFMPNLRHTFYNRERLGAGGRGGNQHGAYGQQDRKDREGTNQSHAPRYRSLGQGRGQQNKHDPRAQNMMNAQKNPSSDLERKTSSQQQTFEKRGSPPSLSSLPSPASLTTSTGRYGVSSNGHPGTGTNPPSATMQHSVNDGSTGFPPELEFGSLGPVQSG